MLTHVEEDFVTLLKFDQQGIIVVRRDLQYLVHEQEPPFDVYPLDI